MHITNIYILVFCKVLRIQDMFELNKKVAPQENLVGWFATGKNYWSSPRRQSSTVNLNHIVISVFSTFRQ